jgi:MraZ protein
MGSDSGIRVELRRRRRGPHVAELLGRHEYQLDPKGRITLPGDYREELRKGVYMTLGMDGCLWAFPETEWERERTEVESWPMSAPGNRRYARIFFGNAERAELDGQGRLVLPRRLREKARLERDVVVIGVGTRLEVWSRDALGHDEDEVEGRYRAGDLLPER